MNIRRKWNGVSFISQSLMNLSQAFHLPRSLGRQPDQLSPRSDEPLALRHAPLNVQRVGVRHRLHHNRVLPAHKKITHTYLHGGAACMVEKIPLHLSNDNDCPDTRATVIPFLFTRSNLHIHYNVDDCPAFVFIKPHGKRIFTPA